LSELKHGFGVGTDGDSGLGLVPDARFARRCACGQGLKEGTQHIERASLLPAATVADVSASDTTLDHVVQALVDRVAAEVLTRRQGGCGFSCWRLYGMRASKRLPGSCQQAWRQRALHAMHDKNAAFLCRYRCRYK
jgi:hypothetical protein